MRYVDTSALVKRYVAEKGSDVVHRLTSTSVATSSVAYVELHAAFARKRRTGHISPAQHRTLSSRLERDWRLITRVHVSDEVLAVARGLIDRHPLRGYDALHLASALRLQSTIGLRITFVAADRRLMRAAAAEGIEGIDVEHVASP